MNRLFEPWSLGDLEIANRVLIAPMCQYSADNGSATDWHLIHLGHLALSGAGMMIVEATAVSPEGRITPQDLGLYSDDNEAALARVLRAVRAYSPIRIAIQIAHAGRKGSSRPPWEKGGKLRPPENGAWETFAPSAVAHDEGEDLPLALDRDGMQKVRDDFVTSALRAVRLGFDGIEVHGAHGYLLHQFLSPLANHRQDAYGGSLENRMRFPLEIFDAVRGAVPARIPVWMRISATDWVPGGWDIDDAVELTGALRARGAAAIHVSSGGVSSAQDIKLGPGYQVPFAKQVKTSIGLPTIAVGLITEPEQAQDIIASSEADAISLARSILYNPRWPWHAAAKLGAHVYGPNQYRNALPRGQKGLFDGWRADNK